MNLPPEKYFAVEKRAKSEPLVHSGITDYLPETHPLAFESVYCDRCADAGKIEMLHAFNNEMMQIWFEFDNGRNVCLPCLDDELTANGG